MPGQAYKTVSPFSDPNMEMRTVCVLVGRRGAICRCFSLYGKRKTS